MFGFNERKQDRMEVNKILENVSVRQKELERLSEQIDGDLGSTWRELQVVAGGKDNGLTALLSALIQSCPLPVWIKNDEGRMIYQNDAYIEQYGGYIGGFDSDHYDKQTSKTFDENDTKVRKNRVTLFCTEALHNPKTNNNLLLQVVKWPIVLGNEIHVCVAGVGFYKLTD